MDSFTYFTLQLDSTTPLDDLNALLLVERPTNMSDIPVNAEDCVGPPPTWCTIA